MSFLAPWWLAVAAAAAAGVVIAHLFSTSVPPRDYLPTVRFVPESAPMAVMRTRRLSDVALLLLRLLAVVLLGLALAGAYVARGGPPRIVLVDASRAVGSRAEARDSAIAAVTDGGVVIAFDSVAGRISRDSLDRLTQTDARGSLSAALVAAHREMLEVSKGRTEIELVIVSPVVREEVDSATAELLSLWQGPVRQVRVAAASSPPVPRVSVRATGDDPIRAVKPQDAVIPSVARDLHSVRLIRSLPTKADSAWARDSGGVLVLWPADVRSPVLPRRATADTQDGIAAGPHVVVARFERTHEPRSGRAIVRWIDGAPAATEQRSGRGCIREVAIPVDPVGDIVLRQSVRGIVATLVEPCGGARDFASADVIPSEARNLHVARDSQVQIPRFARDDRALSLWLAALGLAVLIAEQILRAQARVVA